MTRNSEAEQKALVCVFNDMATAAKVTSNLKNSGIPLSRIELVCYGVNEEAPEISTPKVHETTLTSMLDGATKWGALGAGTGVVAGLLTAFPGLVLGMAAVGGMTGAIVGGMAGIEHSVEDDSVDLPTLEEYEQLVNDGKKLVVVVGTHEQVMNAESMVKEMSDVRRHIHRVHGHEYHEHPSHK